MSFPTFLDQPPQFVGSVPAEADIIVIGGGVIGVCTALFAARAGKRVVLLEKGRIAGEQSSRNWGWIRVQGRDPDEIPIVLEAMRLWQELAQQTNVDIGLRQDGITYLAETGAQMARYAAWCAQAAPFGLDSRMLEGSELAGVIPGLTRRYKGALYTAQDMKAEPWVAVPALAGVAQRAGAQLIEGCAVRALDIAAGHVTGVITEQGRIRAPEVVLAGGAWSSLFLQNHGVFIPQLSVRATVVATAPVSGAARPAYAGGATDSLVAFRHRADGGYSLAEGGYSELFVGPHAVRSLPFYATQLKSDPFVVRLRAAAPRGFPDAWGTPRRWDDDAVTPFEQMRVLNPAPNARKARTLLRRFGRMVPEMAGPAPRAQHVWAGMIDTMPDIVPVVDRVAALPGLTIGTGMSGHGFGIGPGMGRILADLAMGNPARHELARFRLSRFSDGSKMHLGPGI